jgi:hypothetical protein
MLVNPGARFAMGWPVLLLAGLLWIGALWAIRRWARLHSVSTVPASSTAGGCLLTFLPLLQLGMVELLPTIGRRFDLLVSMVAGNLILLVWILIAGFCFLVVELPFSRTLWASLLGNVGITVVGLGAMMLVPVL